MPRILTFNVRYPEPTDGPHIWENRRDAVVATMRAADPDVAGLQEPLIEQVEYLAAAAPEFGWLGVSRYGDRTEKFTPMFYRKDRVTPVEWSSFWLSETPDVIGSAYAGMEKPRLVTWAVFEDLRGARFTCYNTHLQYKKEEYPAKVRSASLIRDRIVARGGPAILTGDFNHPAGEEIHSILTKDLKDCWLESKVKDGPEGTFHGFTGQPRSERRIDWLLFRGAVRAVSCRVLTAPVNGIHPSDHFPVLAEFAFEERTA